MRERERKREREKEREESWRETELDKNEWKNR